MTQAVLGVGAVRRTTGVVMAGVWVAVTALLGAAVPAAASPTTSPTSTPTATPSPAATAPRTSTPAATVPKGSGRPTGTGPTSQPRAGDAGDHADDAHAAAALLQASQELQVAQAQLTLARGALTAAQDELRIARAADARAQTDLEAATLAEQRAARELAVVRQRIVDRQSDLGHLARSAYQSNGPLGEWALVLASDTPEQLADRLAFMQSIASAGNAVISDLREARADLENSKARLTASRKRQETARAAAALALAEKSAKERAAVAAERQVGLVVAVRRKALEAARRAQVEDQRRYQVLLVQSGQLGARIRVLAAALARSARPPHGTGTFVRPGTGPVTSPYGPRLHPILGYVKIHTGLDFGRGDGMAYAADRGVVLLTEFNVAYGNMTVIDHGKIGGLRITTLYAHQAAVAVRAGDRVRKGQPIGVIGSTGYSTGPHLHVEVRVDGQPLDPAPFLATAPPPV